MTGRTKPIADAIVWDETHATRGVTFVAYEPGNATRYLCVFVDLRLSPQALPMLGFAPLEPDGVFMFAWLNRSRGGCAYTFRDAGYLAPTYLAEKLNCGLADAAVLAELIARYTKREADSAGDMTGPRRCPHCDGRGTLITDEPGSYTNCPECDGEGIARLSR